MPLVPVLMLAALLLALPAPAAAKFSCRDRGAPPEGFSLRGLPASPVAGREYQLTATLPPDPDALQPPYLGAEPCGEARGPEAIGMSDGWFLPVGQRPHGTFVLAIEFPRPGPWAISFMTPQGSFHDLGLRPVRPAPGDAWLAELSAILRSSLPGLLS